MKPSEIRTELLQQHAEVREQIEAVKRQLAERAGGDGLRATLTRLAEAVRKHNRREEELLSGILPTVDAWGAARAEIMLEQHVKEHEAIYASLLAAGASTDVAPLMDKMLEHMLHEEKTFLTEEVLADDAIVRDYFGG